VPTIAQIEHVIQAMPASSDIELRNRALIAFTPVTGARDSAAASFKLKHIDLAAGKVIQDAREVRTKFSKSFTTVFFPVGDHVRQIVVDWVGYLMKDKLWGLDDPVFPATRVAVGAGRQFEASGLDRKHWSSATPIRAIFRAAFTRAGLPYFNPHSFRKTLVQLGEKLCRTPEEFKAWSQNLGHEKVLTTFSSYGEVAAGRQTDIIRQLAQPIDPDSQFDEILKQLVRATKRATAG
jgi:integrase/recombinase XerD